jgi:hypothetical protein
MSLRRKLAVSRRSEDPDGPPGKIRFSTRYLAAACGIILAASAALAGTGAAANASLQDRPASSSGTGYAVARTTAVNAAAAVTPASTPPNSWCQGRGSNYFGWFGVAPGSSADGGVANDLWWDAKNNASPAQVQVYTGNGGANQQWCEASIGSGSMIFYSDYVSGLPQCLTAKNGYEDGYPLGLRVTTEDCASISTPTNVDQLWWVCPRSGGSISIEPEAANPSQVWLDVWGGSSDNGTSAFKPMNPLQLWTGNGQDNQRFTLFSSPGEPGGLTYAYSTGVAGC